MTAKTFVSLVAAADVPSGDVRVVVHDGRRYAICNVEGTYHVVDDTCTHDDGPLGEGRLDGCAVVCPRHGARFDVRDGRVLSMPAVYPIRAYKTRVQEGQVQVELSAREVKGGAVS
jgi:3-phenylpropionate/trans-cinnamate dioxygenase ferredoxin subunit